MIPVYDPIRNIPELEEILEQMEADFRENKRIRTSWRGKDFFKNMCRYGACGCAGMMLLSPANLLADTTDPEENKEDWRIGFIQKRMARLIEDMGDELDKETLGLLPEKMGWQCAKENIADKVKFKGDLNGYLKNIEKWVEKAGHDEEKGIITIAGKKNDSCFCPFVDTSEMPEEFCNCSMGWQKETYEAIIGKPVDVSINISVLRGGDRCGFTVRYPVQVIERDE